MAPFGPPVTIPPIYIPQMIPEQLKMIELPGADNTECNYLVLFFIAGIVLLGLGGSMKHKV